jgi:hypothetical protein
MSTLEIGCCAAVCATCPPYLDGVCRGCKVGYDTGARHLDRAKCRIKVCCLRKGLVSCGDCGDFDTCSSLQGLYSKNGYKYRKYRQSMEFIRRYGYERFLEQAAEWTKAYGKLAEPK